MVNGYIHGPGVIKYVNQTSLHINFQMNDYYGPAKIRFPDRSLYEGNVTMGKQDGLGKLITQEYSYEGEFQNGKKNGYGVLKFQSGQTYTGNFKDNLKHGHGTLLYDTGNRYEGNWENDKKNGFGIFDWETQ